MAYDPTQDVEAVDWAAYGTAYGGAERVPRLLMQLASAHVPTATGAAHELWSGLCHQHAYVSSAALPSYPIVLRILANAEQGLAVEILDVLLGFARCSSPGFGANIQSCSGWKSELHAAMQADITTFEALAGADNEEVREFARLIVDAVGGDVDASA